MEDHCIRDFRVAKGNIVLDSTGKQENVLKNNANMGAKGDQFKFTYVHTINENGATINFIKSIQQIDDGGFSGTRGAYQRYRFSGLDVQRDVFQNIFCVIVGEPYTIKFDFSNPLFRPELAIVCQVLLLVQ